MNINITFQLDDKNVLGVQLANDWQYAGRITADDCKDILKTISLHGAGISLIAGAVCGAAGLSGAAAAAMYMFFSYMADNEIKPFFEKGAEGNGYIIYSRLELGPGTVNPSYTLVYKLELA